jgi:hypothetical protein
MCVLVTGGAGFIRSAICRRPDQLLPRSTGRRSLITGGISIAGHGGKCPASMSMAEHGWDCQKCSNEI